MNKVYELFNFQELLSILRKAVHGNQEMHFFTKRNVIFY